jgi:hypothetical protein
VSGKFISFLFIDTHEKNPDQMQINQISIFGFPNVIENKLQIKKKKYSKDDKSIFSMYLYQKTLSDIQFHIGSSVVYAHKILLSSTSNHLNFTDVFLNYSLNLSQL